MTWGLRWLCHSINKGSEVKAMSIFRDLKEADGLTDRETDIRNYLLDHPENVLHMSSRQLGEATYTSAPTVTRLCKKFGCDGWPDFKLRFVSELKDNQGQEEQKTVELSEQENLVTLLQKVSETYDQALDATRKELSLTQLLRIKKLLQNHPYIDFYAYDTNIFLASCARSQLIHTGKVVSVYSESDVQVLSTLLDRPGHLAVLISHSGENSRLIELAHLLQRKRRKIIVLTAYKSSTLAQLADELLLAAAPWGLEKMAWPMFATSVKYLLDLMFAISFSSEYADNVARNEHYDSIGAEHFWGLRESDNF